MKTRLFGCGKFRRLASEAADRVLNSKEIAFLEKHRVVCYECVRMEEQSASALNMLRSIALDAQVNPMYEERVLRRLRVSRTRQSLRYWSPAFLGAGIACVAIFSALQIIETSAFAPENKAVIGRGPKSKSELPLLVLDRTTQQTSPSVDNVSVQQ